MSITTFIQKRILKIFLLLIWISIPYQSFGANVHPTKKTLADLVNDLLGYVNPIVSLLFGAMIIVYIWKIVEALAIVDDPKERSERVKGAGIRIFFVFIGLSFFTLAQVLYRSFF